MKKVKNQIEFRRYDLSGNEPILLMDVDTWKKCYPDGSRILHFHNLMEIGFCHVGDGKLVFGENERIFSNNMISIIPETWLMVHLVIQISLAIGTIYFLM